MEIKDFIQIVCPKCKALLFAEKELDNWYCGHCGEKIEIIREENGNQETAAPVLTGDIFVCDKDTLVKYAGCDEEVDIPENITKIDSGAFKGNTEIKSVNIPDSVIEIASSAFAECTSLSSVSLPSKIKKIALKTFNGCTSLKAITIPESVGEIMNGALCCGLDEIIFESSETTWELENEFADSSFNICRKSSGDGVKKLYFKGNMYEAADVYRNQSIAKYLKGQGLCPKCGGKYGLFNKCKGCGEKKEQ